MLSRRVHYFIAVADHLSFSKASQQVHVTVPALSRQIRHLEEELGVRLFDRDRHRVELTDAGRLLLGQARALVTQAANIQDAIRRVQGGGAGLVRVGIGLGLAERVGRVLVEHSKKYPGVEIQCREMFSNLQNECLREGKIDVGFLRLPVDKSQLVSQLLFMEPMFVYMSKRHRLAKRKPKRLRVTDLAEESLLLTPPSSSIGVHDKILELYRKAGVTPKLSNLSPTLLGSCRGIAILGEGARATVSKHVLSVRLDDPDAALEVHLAWRRKERSPAVLAFLSTARRVFHIATILGGRGSEASGQSG